MYADAVFCMTEQAGNTTENTTEKRSSMSRLLAQVNCVGSGTKKKKSNSFTKITLSLKASSLKIFIL